jgi:hypothetical protein
LLIAALSALTTSESIADNLRVMVAVTGPDELKANISSYINRELRDIKDVDVVDELPDFTISIVGLETSGVRGYAMSLLVEEDLPEWIRSVLKHNTCGLIPSKDIDGLRLYKGIDDHQLLVGPFSELRATCTSIVSRFDTNSLEPRRKLLRRQKEPSGSAR